MFAARIGEMAWQANALGSPGRLTLATLILFMSGQTLYALGFLVEGYFFSLPVNLVDMGKLEHLEIADYPNIILFYPVLREPEQTMRTTFVALGRLRYPREKFRVVSIPNVDDTATVASLRRLQAEFPFVEILEVPPTSDRSWGVVWEAWDKCPKAYWWHHGRRACRTDLPPKKTRQLIYGFYSNVGSFGPGQDFLVNYIDADSAPPTDHLLAAAAGIQEFDVLQSENIAGNLNQSLAASWHAFDHMSWDGLTYQHMSADGHHPYWVLGKGLYFRATDLVALGGFHPWITIEDPEVGIRFWVNGKRLGIIKNPLIEEVPITFSRGITQRKRWIAGFFQTLSSPLRSMGMTFVQRMRARLNFLPCLSLLINIFGFPTGLWALVAFVRGEHVIPVWAFVLPAFNCACYIALMTVIYRETWLRTEIVCTRLTDRVSYMLRINPVFLFVWWLIWIIPIVIGFWMFLRDSGLVWERTKKIDANAVLVRRRKDS